MTTHHTLDVPGARLRYEVCGTGPLLLLMGSPMGSAAFAPLAEELAGEFTVVTHDPRGISGSVLDDPEQDSTPELRANDVSALLDALDAESADMFGSSGGAMTLLALAAQEPRRVRTLVAHEPPALELLPDARQRRAEVDAIVETFHREGMEAAFGMFMATSGLDDDAHGTPAPPPGEPSEQDLVDGARFFGHEIGPTTRYVPEVAALRTISSRIFVGIGTESGGLLTYETSTALAERLGRPTVEFPGDHGGFLAHPKEFGETLYNVLTGVSHAVR